MSRVGRRWSRVVHRGCGGMAFRATLGKAGKHAGPLVAMGSGWCPYLALIGRSCFARQLRGLRRRGGHRGRVRRVPRIAGAIAGRDQTFAGTRGPAAVRDHRRLRRPASRADPRVQGARSSYVGRAAGICPCRCHRRWTQPRRRWGRSAASRCSGSRPSDHGRGEGTQWRSHVAPGQSSRAPVASGRLADLGGTDPARLAEGRFCAARPARPCGGRELSVLGPFWPSRRPSRRRRRWSSGGAGR